MPDTPANVELLTVAEIANKWGVTPRRVQILCREGKLANVVKKGGVWFIPENTTRPTRYHHPSTALMEQSIPDHFLKTSMINTQEQRTLKVLSLFSGCGGMDLGFEGGFCVPRQAYNPRTHPHWQIKITTDRQIYLPKTRFQTVFANDIRPDAQTAWTNFFGKRGTPKSAFYLDSIVDLVKLQEHNHQSIFPKNIDVVTGGFPCQDFSVAGKRGGFNSNKSHLGQEILDDKASEENRGTLYIWMRKVIEITRPKVFVAENVKGLTNLQNVQQIIEQDFASIGNQGYLVVPARVLLAAHYGVPQSRERVFFIGLNKSALKPDVLASLSQKRIPISLDPYPLMSHNDNDFTGVSPFVTLREAFDGLLEPEHATDIDQQKFSKAKFMGKHCQGQTEIKLDSIAPTIRSEHHGNIEFRRLSAQNGGNIIEELGKGLSERRLSIRECARIQTFPDDYQFVQEAKEGYKNVSASDAYKLIGNAVPPLLAYHVAMRLQELWKTYFKED